MLDELTIYNLTIKYPNTVDLVREVERMARTEAIEEYKLKLLNAKTNKVNDIHKAGIWVELKKQAIEIAEQLKENKE